MPAMKEKLKTVRLQPKIYKALRKFQSESFMKASLESVANAAMIVGIDSLRNMVPKKQN